MSNSTRLAQVAEIKIELLEPLHIQLDGEPWLQPPCTITIKHHSAPLVLQAPTRRQMYEAAS
eukprot:6674517-Prymnesium_polylepis.1